MKMTRFEILDKLVEEGNGYLCTSQVVGNGISKPTLADYVSKRGMERVAQGVYISEDTWPDELYILCLTNSRVVFSHETYLFLHGLMEREPKTISVTVKAGYNASHLRKKGVRVYQVRPDAAETGVVNVRTNFGNIVRTYDMERTICDILRYKDEVDVQVFQFAMKEYMGSKQKNLNHLMAYAKQFQIEPSVRVYTEVML